MDPQTQMMLQALMGGQQAPQQGLQQQGIAGVEDQTASLGNQPPDAMRMMGALFQQPPQVQPQ